MRPALLSRRPPSEASKACSQSILPTHYLSTDLSSNNQINSGLVKGDYHINDKNTLTGMYFISPGNGILADNPGRQLDLSNF